MSEENLAVVQAFADRVNEQDIPGFLGLVDPEVEFHTFRGVERGLEGHGGSLKATAPGSTT
jgi:hypothetical protein